MEAFLGCLLPRLLDGRATFRIYPHQGKADLLGKLEARLRGYAAWLPEAWRIVILIDRDDEDCRLLKARMEAVAAAARLPTPSTAGGGVWRVLNRIVVEELEAWYFGERAAVRRSYPRLPDGIPSRAPYRDPDGIAGGTWEAFERVLQRAGYFSTGLRKLEAARAVGAHLDSSASLSRSFRCFRDGLLSAVERFP